MIRTTKHIRNLLLIVMSSIFMLSCERDDNIKLELQSPYGHWRVDGVVTDTKNQSRNRLYNEANKYDLILNSDSSFVVHHNDIEIEGDFSVTTARRIIRFNVADISSLYTGGSWVYLHSLGDVTNYKVFTDQLRLYVSSSEYILFNKVY